VSQEGGEEQDTRQRQGKEGDMRAEIAERFRPKTVKYKYQKRQIKGKQRHLK
jgi:hypothetical protein